MVRQHMGELTVSELARHLGMARPNLVRIVNGRSGISAAMALKLSEAFPLTTPEWWMDLQSLYELDQARVGKRKKVRPVAK
jgi:addiction module HigA family antidote